MNGILAVFYRDYRQRITNIAFVFWDLFVPIAYLLLFGLGFELTLGAQFSVQGTPINYLEFFLPGVLAMVTSLVRAQQLLTIVDRHAHAQTTPARRSMSSAASVTDVPCAPAPIETVRPGTVASATTGHAVLDPNGVIVPRS